MFDPLSLQEIQTFFTFADLNPKFSLVLLQPYMLSILGNMLFMKFLLPLCASSFKDPLYNWSLVRKHIYSKLYIKKLTTISVDFLNRNRGNITAALVTIFPSSLVAHSLYQYFRGSAIIPHPQVEPEQSRNLGFREMVNNIPEARGLERYHPWL